MASTLNTYTGGGINPCQDPAGAIMQSVNLPASVLLTKGTVMGIVPGTGTAIAEVQTITPGGTISGGTWRIVYDGETTSALAHNASTGTIQAALEALPSIGAGGVTVSGAALNAGNVVLTFAGALAGQHHPTVSVINSLTGTAPTATPSLTTLGKPAGGYWGAYNDGASGGEAGLAVARGILKYDCRTDSQGRIYGSIDKNASDNSSWGRSTPVYVSGMFNTGNGSALVLTGLDANGVTDLGRIVAGDPATLTGANTILRIG